MKRLFSITFLVCCTLGYNTRVSAQIINTIAGNSLSGYCGDGVSAIATCLNSPTGVAVDAMGNVYIADSDNHRIRKVNTSGVISTFAGNGTAGFSGDGGAATSASLNGPTGVDIDVSGNVYIADFYNGRVRKVNSLGIISTIAGNGTPGFSGDGGAATNASLSPFGIAFDISGNVYIADVYNQRIRKVNSSGIISTIAGNGTPGFSGDGGAATDASLHDPFGVAVDASGNVYIADRDSHRIRKVNSSGVITTIAGNGTPGFSGDGGAATSASLSSPFGVTVDASGNVYIADMNNHRIRKVNSSRVITTIAGSGSPGISGNGGLATNARLYIPSGVAFHTLHNLYIADMGNCLIRSVTASPSGVGLVSSNIHSLSLYPNPNEGSFTIKGSVANRSQHTVTLEVYNTIGQSIYKEEVAVTNGMLEHKVDLSRAMPGNYFVKLNDGESSVVRFTVTGN